MLKKILLLATIMVVLLAACGGNTPNDPIPPGNDGNNDSGKGNEVEEVFADFQGSNPAKMSGNSDKQYTITMTKGSFLFVMKTKDQIKGLTNVSVGGSPVLSGNIGAGKDDSGWYIYESIQRWYSDGSSAVDVKAKGPFEILIYKFPLPENSLTLPGNWHGKGTRVVGPFSCGSALTVKVKTEDAQLAGFTVDLYDAADGLRVESVYTNVNLSTGEAANQFDTEVSLNPSGSGNYVMLICANGDCSWEIQASE